MRKLILAFTLLSNYSLFTQEFMVEGIKYKITSSTTVKVSDYSGESKTIIIPTTVINDGIKYSVTAIGEKAFALNVITSVTIPDNVTTIAEKAFYLNYLSSITIPDSVTTIGVDAFVENELTSVISESLNPATLLDNVFDDRTVIDLSIPKGTTGAYLEAGWTGFKSVTEQAIEDFV